VELRKKVEERQRMEEMKMIEEMLVVRKMLKKQEKKRRGRCETILNCLKSHSLYKVL
jgi:hypothetical protein